MFSSFLVVSKKNRQKLVMVCSPFVKFTRFRAFVKFTRFRAFVKFTRFRAFVKVTRFRAFVVPEAFCLGEIEKVSN